MDKTRWRWHQYGYQGDKAMRSAVWNLRTNEEVACFRVMRDSTKLMMKRKNASMSS